MAILGKKKRGGSVLIYSGHVDGGTNRTAYNGVLLFGRGFDLISFIGYVDPLYVCTRFMPSRM